MPEATQELEDFAVTYPETEERNGNDNNYDPLPDGLYPLEVQSVRYKAHKRGPMFGIMCKVTEGDFKGRIAWANIIFLPYWQDKDRKKVTPGAGIARSFLKAIGQEYKGEKIRISPKAWSGKTFGAKIKTKNGRNDIMDYYTDDAFKAVVEKATKVEALPESEIF